MAKKTAKKSASRSTARKAAPRGSKLKKALKAGAAKAKKIVRKVAPARARPAAPKQVAWRPAGVGTVTPNLVFRDTVAAIEFYKRAFGAEELRRMPTPDGTGTWHAEIRIGDSILFMSDALGPGPTAASADHTATCAFMIYVQDCDALVRRATEAGCTATMPVADMFWGDRMGGLKDPFGQHWMVGTKQRQLTDDESRKAGAEWAQKNMTQAPPGPQSSEAPEQAATDTAVTREPPKTAVF